MVYINVLFISCVYTVLTNVLALSIKKKVFIETAYNLLALLWEFLGHISFIWMLPCKIYREQEEETMKKKIGQSFAYP